MLTESAQKLAAGDFAPDFSLNGIDGKLHALPSLAGKKGTLVIFMCNHCPYVQAKIPEMNELYSLYSKKGISLIGISSNDAAKYPADSFENMKLFAKEKGIMFPYLYDESQETARAYGAACTPDPFLFDSSLSLSYHGRFDDAPGIGGAAKNFFMREAIDSLLAGRKPSLDFHPSMGCSIKWK